MGKILTASVSALLLLGSLSAFAKTITYTDPDSGFKLKSQPSWMEIGGKNFYGLANKPDKKEASLNVICAFTAKEVEEATGEKFSTEEFLRKYKDLQVLERNELSPDKVNYMLFMPDPYEIKADNKLSLTPKELLDNSTISISTNKNGKQPYVYLHIVDKGNTDTLKSLRRSVDMQIAITSANNMLYTVVSTFPLPNLKAQKDKIEEATPFSKKKVRSEFTDGNKEKLNSYIASRKTFLKGLSFFAPVKDTVPFGFNDELLGGRIKLPENWAYAQVNDNTLDINIPVKVTLAMPWSGLSEFLVPQKNADNAAEKKDDAKPLSKEDISKINFQKISEAVLFASSKAKDKNTFSELFNNPFLTNLLIDKFINEGLKHPSVKEYVDFNAINTKSNFTNNYGTIELSGNGSVKNNFKFNLNANAMFTPQTFGLTAYISKDEKKMDTELEKIFGSIKLLSK
ncbi:hypothetical protein SAMN05216245_102210 [Succiniclasticum ruminis DSM 9236]|uniref:Uncharacterized protein n=2 Tax=Succiniclasticum ruminis TaxID=40841 RepID=A0A1I1YHU4_9FIRM|nr:hypothetical protein SAMN05216245_102210 [Succiniclasticum ruminis DSM 9236]